MFHKLREYWVVYGGWTALLRSAYLWLAVTLTLVTYPYWSAPCWWTQVIAVIPNLLGFTLGGFAIFLAFGDEKFRALIGGSDPNDGGGHSPYLEVCTAFVHFAFVQFLALMYAIVANALYVPAPDWLPAAVQRSIPLGNIIAGAFGYLLFLYGLMLALAAVLGTFDVATWYDEWRTEQRREADNEDANK